MLNEMNEPPRKKNAHHNFFTEIWLMENPILKSEMKMNEAWRKKICALQFSIEFDGNSTLFCSLIVQCQNMWTFALYDQYIKLFDLWLSFSLLSRSTLAMIYSFLSCSNFSEHRSEVALILFNYWRHKN